MAATADYGPDSVFQGASTLPPEGWGATGAGARGHGVDHAAVWRQVEAEAARVVVVDLVRRAIVAGRAMRAEVGARRHGEAPLEQLFPGATSQMQRWCSELPVDSGEPVAQSLSPRQWIYFWRLNPKTALLAVVRHRHGRGAADADDTATIRLLSEHWLAPELHAMGIGRAALAPWNRIERRSRAGAPPELRGALATIGLATLCALWLALGAATPPAAPMPPPPSAELQRLSRLADETLVHGLALVMSGRDYGEAQEALERHLTLGHFDAAVLLNERRQVVAHAGLAQPPAIGHPLPAGVLSQVLHSPLHSPQHSPLHLPLHWAGEPIGELIKVPRTSAPPPPSAAPPASTHGLALRIAAALMAAIGLLSGALLWRHLRARYR